MRCRGKIAGDTVAFDEPGRKVYHESCRPYDSAHLVSLDEAVGLYKSGRVDEVCARKPETRQPRSAWFDI